MNQKDRYDGVEGRSESPPPEARQEEAEGKRHMPASFTEFSPYPVLEVDLSGNILYTNPAASVLAAEIRAAHADHPFLYELSSVVSSLLNGKDPFVVREIWDSKVCYEQTLYYINKSRSVCIHVRDITKRKNAEEQTKHLLEALATSNSQWETTFDSVTETIIIVDEDLRVIRCNKRFIELLKKPIFEIMGKKCTELLPYNFSHLKDKLESIPEGKQLPPVWIETEDGKWLYLNYSPVTGENNGLKFIVITATDITDIKEAQQKLIDAEKELKDRVKELEKFYDMAVGRELRMKELKIKIAKLEAELSACGENAKNA